MLVEDEDALRHLCARVLEASGYKVLTAATGEEALVVLERHDCHVKLLLTDVFMPGIKGNELARLVHQRCRGTRVLFTSGWPGEALQFSDVIRDNAEFLQKPFSADELRNKVRHLLDVNQMTP